jgi:ubiquinone/menaquinone biosynthesis C-methylase UbiE
MSATTALEGPQAVLQMHFAMLPARALAAAVQLDIFSPLADGPRDAAAVATTLGASPRGVRMLLDAMAAVRLLDKSGGRYALTPLARAHLLRASPDYVGALLETDEMWNAWAGLPGAVRAGRPVMAVDREERAAEFFPVLIRSLHVMNRAPARELAAALATRGGTALDVACGSAVWSIACAEADPALRVVANDFPRVLDETRRYVARHGLGERYDYLAGNLRTVDFGSERYDLALLGHIVHGEGERSSRDLFKRLHRALRPGGRIAVIDFVPDEDRAGPPPAVLFALNMLVHTEEGDTFTLSEYTSWLTEAGFREVKPIDISTGPVRTATAVVAVRR